jgi:hypothetical protein
MNFPRLEVYINKKKEFCLAKIRSNAVGSELCFAVDLNELKSLKLDEVEKWLGTISFGIIRNLYIELFENWSSNVVIEEKKMAKFDLAMELMHISLCEKTPIHVPSIELLFHAQIDPSELMREMIEESWPTIKKRLLSFDS